MTRKAPPHAWKPGQSGNPSGRTRGAGQIGKLRTAIGEHVPAIIANLVELALAGDVQAARLLLERAVPAVRPESLPVSLPLPEGLAAQGQAVLAATAKGRLGIHEGAALLNAIGQHARALEAADLAQRVEALERRPD